MTTEQEEMKLHSIENGHVMLDGNAVPWLRFKVPGGWLYGMGHATNLVFVPEPFELIPTMLEEFTPGPVDV